ncbi:MAG: DNA-3-methyladenine glycosylase 2 family protein [Proteobacteria bacterium]|nr:DNA-3-methyladenine glycosylase 2 family protein [Pseudomonadota bacterium]
MAAFKLTKRHLKSALDKLSARDGDMAKALKLIGYPEEHRNPKGFQTLMHILAAQQLSTRAAATIIGRLHDACAPELAPETFMRLEDEAIRAVGFSRQKLAYGRGLSEAVQSGRLVLERLETMTDQEVMAALTALKGFGRWSAEMYLIASLGRPDIWPADDLAVQEGVRRLKGLEARPGQKEMDAIAEPWRPYRTAAAIFIWHYYKNAPPP